jgi:hypothetical protein
MDKLEYCILLHPEYVDLYIRAKFESFVPEHDLCTTCNNRCLTIRPGSQYSWCLKCYKYKVLNGLGKYVLYREKLYIVRNVAITSYSALCDECSLLSKYIMSDNAGAGFALCSTCMQLYNIK